MVYFHAAQRDKRMRTGRVSAPPEMTPASRGTKGGLSAPPNQPASFVYQEPGPKRPVRAKEATSRLLLVYGVFAAVIATTLAAATITALAANPYDGTWRVNITTTAGTCGSGVGFNLQVRNGIVYGYGDFRVSGRVTPRGDTRVAITSGQSQATGSGRLRGSSGGGSWRGTGSQGLCSGYWNANRV